MTRSARLGLFALVFGIAVGATPAAGYADVPPMDDADVVAFLETIDAAVAAGEPVTLDWRTMASLNYRTGEMSEALRRLNGVQVRVPGFMVPLEDWEEQVTEFILVPYFGACIHTPPPPPNQMAHVLMTRNRRVAVNLWDPVWVVGTLKIESVDSPYGAVGYQLAAEGIRPYEG